MSEPRRVGLMQLLRTSYGSQFVIPVYQRNYTWSADKEVKQYLSDLENVLLGKYKNHFLGILIYLEKSIDFSAHELSVIDGQQRLTTTFLTIYAVKEIFKNNGETDRIKQLEEQFLTNPWTPEKIKYKLKPLVADDNVYKCIVEDRLDEIDNENSAVYKNYQFIRSYLQNLLSKGYNANEILLAMDKLYVVCVPISEEDNAQKIFESINATGVKLTAADLIRNFMLMNLDSDSQDKFYSDYWRKIEENVSADSKELELFFRMYLAIKTHSLSPKNAIYRTFVDWANDEAIPTEDLFKELLEYAKIYYTLNKAPLSTLSKELEAAITDFRKINSDLPMSIIMEFYRLHNNKKFNTETLARLISSINSFLIRRSICDMDSQNISKLFPTILKRCLDHCAESFINIVDVLNQEMVGNNADTSGSYMPTDTQMHDFLFNANVYKRPALRIILDRLELNNNPAPVDLSKLSIEHLMPQTPTEEWLAELDTTEEIYMTHLHRLGNLTLAAKSDNSKMGNLQWEYKNTILKSTAHLKMNMELLPVDRWTIDCIDKRTKTLIERICNAFPYPDVSIAPKSSDNLVDEMTARRLTVAHLFSNAEEIEKNNIYKTKNGTNGHIMLVSKNYPEGNKEKYWFGYRHARFEKITACEEKFCVLVCRNKTTLVIKIPTEFLESYKDHLNTSCDQEGNITHYHIVIHRTQNKKVSLLLSKPTPQKIDISDFVVAEL